jgi:hypothetical protein
MSVDVPSPNVLEGTELARELWSVKHRLLAMLDFSVLDEAMDNGPGRDPKYSRSSMTKGVLYAISQNKYSYDAIAQCLQTYPARRLCGFRTETPVASTVCRFWERVWEYLPLIFEYVTDVLETCDIYGDTFAIDATALPTSQDDPDAVWAFDEHSEDNFYYGYGLVAVVDCASDLPAGAVFCQRKQHGEDTSIECLTQAMETTEIDTILGDAWYDTLDLHEFCADRETLPICTFNPRNSEEDYDYRIEKLVEEDEIDEALVEEIELDETFRQRQAAERLFGVLKDDDRKLEFTKRGFERVATQVYLVLINRLLTALAKWERNPDANLRSVR